MRPVDQSKLYSEVAIHNGNCFAATEEHALASLPEFYIANGMSSRGVFHSVVYSGGKLVYDPHWMKTGITSVDWTWHLETVNTEGAETPVRRQAQPLRIASLLFLRMKSILHLVVGLWFAIALYGQSCSITSPSASQLIQSPEMLALTLSCSSAPTAYRAVYYIDGLRGPQAFNADQHQSPVEQEEAWTGTPFAAQFQVGKLADGPHFIYAKVFDIFTDVSTGTPLATTPTVNFTTRLEGLSNISITIPTSGVAPFGVGGPPVSGMMVNSSIDGMDTSSNVSQSWPAFYAPCGANNQSQTNTYCWPDGAHLVNGNFTGGSDPMTETQSFSSVSGNLINLPNHVFQNGNPVVFTSVTGLSPVSAGCQYFWTGSNYATLSISSAVMTFALSSACAAVPNGTVPVNIKGVPYTAVINGQGTEICDGYYPTATLSGTTLTVVAPNGCPNGISVSGCTPTTCDLEVDINPYFAQVASGTLTSGISLSASPGGSTIALTCATCSGTIQTRLESPWWSCGGQNGYPGGNLTLYDFMLCGGRDSITQLATFNNTPTPTGTASSGASSITVSSATNIGTNQTISGTGLASGTAVTSVSGTTVNISPVTTGAVSGTVTFHSPMQIQIPFRQYFGNAGKSGDTLCPSGILNTDRTLTAEACSYFTYAVVNTYGITGAISINSSTGAITYNPTPSWSCSGAQFPVCPPAQGAWVQVQVHCGASGNNVCGTGGSAVPWATAQIANCGASACAFPHFTPDEGIVSSFTPGHSFYSIGLWQNDPNHQQQWAGTVFQHSNVNTIWYSIFTNSDMTGLLDPSATSCPVPSAQPSLPGIVAFLNTYKLASVFDQYSIWSDWIQNLVSLQAILNNTGYNRQQCITNNLVPYIRAAGRGLMAWNADDEIDSNQLGYQLNPNATIGGQRWSSSTCSGGMMTFNISGLPNITSYPWSQSAGTGAAFQVLGLTTNSAYNGWYLPTSATTSTAIVAPTPTGGCPTGNITSSTDFGAQLASPPVYAPAWQNSGYLPWNLSAPACTWSTDFYGGSNNPPCIEFGQYPSTAYLTVSGSVATLHLPSVSGLVVGQALRIWSGTTANLNIIAPITSINTGATTVTFNYPGTTGAAAPNCTGSGGQCNSTTDPFAYVTFDPNLGYNPIAQYYAFLNSIANPVPNFWTVRGDAFLGGEQQTLSDYEGNPANASASWCYQAVGPSPIYSYDSSVWQWSQYMDTACGIASRPYMLPARGALLATGGPVNNNATIQMCKTFGYDVACDRPTQLNLRPETMVAQRFGLRSDGISADRLYDQYDRKDNGYNLHCCGYSASANWQGTAMSQDVGTARWKAYALSNALLHAREDTELQPECNALWMGPYFKTDCHSSSTYGNELTVVSGDEMPYGQLTLPLNSISGGSTIEYDLDGYRLRVNQVSGNPSSITREWSPSAGFTAIYVSQPSGYSALDNINFAPPASLPYGAAKFLVQVGYYPDDMRDDPVKDCTSGCSIAVDHHNLTAYYRIIYANSNSLPLSIGSPVQIPSQGLY